MQIDLREGMAEKHIECLKYLEKYSRIREYCSMCPPDVKKVYNKVVMAYGHFLRIHSQFLNKFILMPLKQNNPEQKDVNHKGTAGMVIMEIIMRYKDVEKQCLEIENTKEIIQNLIVSIIENASIQTKE